MRSNKIVYKSFWDERKSAYDKYFEKIISNEILDKYDKIEIFSVFGPGPAVKEENTLYIHFTGESYYYANPIYDLYLIPHKPNGQNVLALPLAQFVFGMNEIQLSYLKTSRALPAKTNFCLFVNRNGCCSIRNDFFFLLNNIKRVDAAGPLFNNMNGGFQAPPDFLEYKEFAKPYKFQLCFENSTVDYYLTEKIINAYFNDTIPIYWGCPQVKELLNEKAFLYLPPEPTEEDVQTLLTKIFELDSNDELYYQVYSQPLILGKESPFLDSNHTRNEIDKMFLK